MERINPTTSHEAYKSMTKGLLSNHHTKIIEALSILGKATFEEIANYLDWEDKNRAARRLSELEREQIIYKPGEKKPTKSGRNAFVYSLIKKSDQKSEYTQSLLFNG
jgi:predicted transcriptional regulator